MKSDDPLEELWLIKEAISEQFSSARELVAAADRIAKTEPLPPPSKNRKMIEGFPRGQSVADDDENMLELRQIREKLLEEAGGDIQKLVERAEQEARQANPSRKLTASSRKKGASHGSFRSVKNKSHKT